MIKYILGFLAFSIFNFAYGQEIREITKNSNGFREQFNVLAADKKIKHGLYEKFEWKDKLIISGMYDSNRKVGEWKFYFNGELEQVFDFTSNEMKFSRKPEYPAKAIVNGAIEEVQLDSSPTYIGSKAGLNEELNKVVSYPGQALKMGVHGKVLVSVWINENNEISDVKVVRGIMAECDKELIEGLAKVEKNWLAGIRNGEKMKSELLIVVEFSLEAGNKTIRVL